MQNSLMNAWLVFWMVIFVVSLSMLVHRILHSPERRSRRRMDAPLRDWDDLERGPSRPDIRATKLTRGGSLPADGPEIATKPRRFLLFTALVMLAIIALSAIFAALSGRPEPFWAAALAELLGLSPSAMLSGGPEPLWTSPLIVGGTLMALFGTVALLFAVIMAILRGLETLWRRGP
jgi:hypothetical protein